MNNTFETSLALANNLLREPLSEEIKDRLRAYIDCPCRDHWDDIYSIIISPKYTVWQAIVEIDPEFPRVGKRTDHKGFIIRDWTQIPTVETLVKALYFVTH